MQIWISTIMAWVMLMCPTILLAQQADENTVTPITPNARPDSQDGREELWKCRVIPNKSDGPVFFQQIVHECQNQHGNTKSVSCRTGLPCPDLPTGPFFKTQQRIEWWLETMHENPWLLPWSLHSEAETPNPSPTLLDKTWGCMVIANNSHRGGLIVYGCRSRSGKTEVVKCGPEQSCDLPTNKQLSLIDIVELPELTYNGFCTPHLPRYLPPVPFCFRGGATATATGTSAMGM